MSRRNERSSRATGPQKASSIISNLFARKGYASVQSANELSDAWKKAVGDQMALETRANRVNGGKLEVTVGNSSVLQELSFQQHHLLKQMQDELPDQAIQELRFRVGSVS